jgi:hypothetical protein
MELFLNLCWFSLLVPAFFLWQSRSSSSPTYRPLVFLCVLGCGLVLLFPVISATDDLHAMRPEMEESEQAFRHGNNCDCAIHAPAPASQLALLNASGLSVSFEQIGKVANFVPQTGRDFGRSARVGRAPPSADPTLA